MENRLVYFKRSTFRYISSKQNKFSIILIRTMEKGIKQTFVEIPLSNFAKKTCQFPSSLFESRFALTQKNIIQYKKILSSHGYHVISLISTQRIIFSTKSPGNTWIGAVELKELPQSQKNLYLSLNVSQALDKTIQHYFLMKNWKIQNKLYLHDQKGNGIALVEYHLAESDLQSFLEQQRASKKKIQLERLYQIFKMLLESMHNSHIENIHLNDIRPQTIFYQNNKWFIMKGELSQKIQFQYGATLSKPIILKPPNKLYGSPLVYDSIFRNDQVISHNPFKSDVYSLGIVMFELQTIGKWTAQQFKQILQLRKNILQESMAFSFDFRQKILIKGKQVFMIPGSLQLMLQEKQAQRPYIFEISLLMNYTNLIMSKVLVPHQQFYKSEVVHTSTGRKKIIYPHVPIEYQGGFKQGTIQKQGVGIVYYNGVKTFEGTWKNNLPFEKCSIFFSEHWKYQGFMLDGQFHDQGYLFFNGSRLNQKKWHNNLSQDRVDLTQKCVRFPNGYYFFVKSNKKIKQDQKQYKVYFKKINESKKIMILNMYLVDPKQIMHVLHKLLLPYRIQNIQILQQQNKVLYNCSKYELIRLHTIQGKQIQILTGLDHARSLLFKLLEVDIFTRMNLNINLSDTALTDDQIRDIFEKPAKIESLNISKCKIGDKGLRILSIVQGTKSLKSLNLSHLDITDKGLSQFVFSKLLQNLEDLNISFCKALSSQTIATFLCNQKLRKLRRIQIQSTSFTHYGLQHLIKFNNFNRLQYLNIGLCHKINDAYFNSFLQNKICSQMVGLSLNSTILTDSILEVMSSEQSKIKSLQYLNLSGSINLTFYGLSRLFLSSKIKNIKNINLSGTYVDDQFLFLLSKQCRFDCKIKEINLSSCFAITDKGVVKLLKSQDFSQLQVLNVNKTFVSNDFLISLTNLSNRTFKNIKLKKCTKINDSGLQKFIWSDIFRAVELLDIGNLGVQSETFIALAESKNSTSLKQISLQECTKIEEKSLIKYFDSQNFKNLQKINLSKTLISNKVLQSFEINSHNYCKFIEIDLTDCRNINNEGLQCICFPNKLISTIQRKEQDNNSVRHLANSPLLLKMTKFETSTISEIDLPILFTSQYCMNLSTIDISDSSLKTCFQVMSDSKYLKNIKVLSLKSCNVDQNSFKTFLKSENVVHLQELDISWTLLGNPTLFAISQSQFLKYLETLRIIKCINVNDKGMNKYVNSKVCQSLKTLDLRATLVTNNTLQCIAKSSNIRQLTSLSIRSCSNIKNLGLQHLLNSRNSHNLKFLDLSWNNFTGEIFRYLTNSKELHELKELQILGLKNIEHQLGKYLNSNNVNSLKKLDLSSATFGEDVAKIIGNSEALQSLDELIICNCNLSRSSIISILGSKNIEKIQKLGLSQNWNSNEIAKFLVQNSSKFQKLQSLIISPVKTSNLQSLNRTFRNISITVESK